MLHSRPFLTPASQDKLSTTTTTELTLQHLITTSTMVTWEAPFTTEVSLLTAIPHAEDNAQDLMLQTVTDVTHMLTSMMDTVDVTRATMDMTVRIAYSSGTCTTLGHVMEPVTGSAMAQKLAIATRVTVTPILTTGVTASVTKHTTATTA